MDIMSVLRLVYVILTRLNFALYLFLVYFVALSLFCFCFFVCVCLLC